MMPGTLFFVVGASGVGKDTLIAGAKAALAGDDGYVFAQRTITRAADAGGEDHLAMSAEAFAQLRDAGGFLVHWSAHGLSYGLPADLADALARGRHVVANGSRAAIPALAARVAGLTVVEVTASPETIAARLRSRGRESDADIAARIARSVPPYPEGLRIVRVANDADVDAGVAALLAALRTAAAAPRLPQDVIDRFAAILPARAASPPSQPMLERKRGGAALTEAGYAAVLRDIIAGAYGLDDVADFLTATARTLTPAELPGLARARRDLAPRLSWERPMVADKHSIGGIPGNRITMLVVPIVAAHGLAMPKTSSRAITSAAGTADAMETLAQVDLDAADVRRVVDIAGGCMVWNGRLNHSVIDDVMNAITRPLAIDTGLWSVASILSKKAAAGATHVAVDLPVGPAAKLKTRAEAERVAALFERVGRDLGLAVAADITDGSGPVGRGIGPALETRDVLAVLGNDPAAPADLRDKALAFAARILAWDLGSLAVGRATADYLLASGKADAVFQRIVDAQGRHGRPHQPGALTAAVAAERSGTVSAIDGWTVAGIARQAGAPRAKGAGVDLIARRGDAVRAGDPLYIVHAESAADRDAALDLARRASGFLIG